VPVVPAAPDPAVGGVAEGDGDGAIDAVGVPGCAELGTTIGFDSMNPPLDPLIEPMQPVMVTVCARLDDAVVCVFGWAALVLCADAAAAKKKTKLPRAMYFCMTLGSARKSPQLTVRRSRQLTVSSSQPVNCQLSTVNC
jgi:hypothetical protein